MAPEVSAYISLDWVWLPQYLSVQSEKERYVIGPLTMILEPDWPRESIYTGAVDNKSSLRSESHNDAAIILLYVTVRIYGMPFERRKQEKRKEKGSS